MFELTNMEDMIRSLPDRTEKALMAYGETSARKLQSIAARERPWTDRTSHARQRLEGYCKKDESEKIRIYLAHGVDYGVELEFKYEKRYAIIYPTLRREAPKIVSGLKKVVGNL